MILWQISVVVNFRIIRIWPFEQWSNTGFRSLDQDFLSKNAKTNNSKMDQNCNSTRNQKFRRKKDCPKLIHIQQVSQRAKIVNPLVSYDKIITIQLINLFTWKDAQKVILFRQCSLEGHLGQLRVIVRWLNGVWFWTWAWNWSIKY